MKTIHQLSSRLRFSLVAAIGLFLVAAGAASASPIPTTSDEARALAGRKPAPEPTRATVAHYRPASSTDEARELPARSLPVSGAVAKVGQAKARVTSSDEARAAIAAADNRPAERQTARGSRTRASAQRP